MASTSSETSNNTCSICYDAVQIRGKLNCCDHLFCFGCIETWSKDSNACPLCKNKFRSVTKVEDGKVISKRTVPKRQFHHEYDAEYYGVPEHLIYGGDDEYLDALDDMDVDENGNLLGFIADEDLEEDDFSEEDLEEEIIFDEQEELEEPEVRFRSRHSSNNTVVLSDSEDEEEPEAASFLYDEPEEDENIIPFEEDDEEEEDEIDPQMRYFYEEAEEADYAEDRQMEQETTRNRRRILQQQEEEERVEQIRPQFRRIPDRRRSRLRSQIIDLSDSQQEQEHSSQELKDTAEEIEVIPNPVYTSPARRRLIKRKKLNNKVIELDKSASVLLDEEDQVASSSSSSDSSRTEEEVEIEISPVNYNNGKSVLGKRKQNKKTQVVDLSDE